MKLSFLYFLSFIWVSYSYGQENTKKQLFKQIKNQNFEEIKIELRENIEHLKNSIKLSGIQFSGGPIIRKENDFIENFIVADYNYVKDKIEEHVKKEDFHFYQYFGQGNNANESIIKVSTPYPLRAIETLSAYREMDDWGGLHYSIQRIYYGQNIKKVNIEIPNNQEGTEVENWKKIDSIELTIRFPYLKNIKNVSLKELDLDNNFKLNFINDSTLSFSTNQNIANKIIYVEGLHKNGKALKNYSSSQNSSSSDSRQQYQKDFLFLLEDIQKKMEQKKITNKQEFVDYFIEHQPKEKKQKTTSSTEFYYTYSAGINNAIVYYDAHLGYEEVKIYLKNETKYNNGLTTARFYSENDSNQINEGLIDKNGNWIIQPNFMQIDHKIATIYQGKKNKLETCKTYELDLQNKVMNELPFNFSGNVSDLHQDKYLEIYATDNTYGKGLLNIETKEIVFKTSAKSWLFVDNAFYGEYKDLYNNRNRSYKIHRFSDHKKIIEGEFYDIEFDEHHIITKYANKLLERPQQSNYAFRSGEGAYYETYLTIFDLDGHILNENQYRAEGDYERYSDGLLLVKDFNSNPYFIDEAGYKVTIDLSLYSGIESFSNGLARVQGKNRKYGYINKKGELVIPLMYNHGRYFMNGTALVDYTDNNNKTYTMLINKNNEMVYKIPDNCYVYMHTHTPNHKNPKYTTKECGNLNFKGEPWKE